MSVVAPAGDIKPGFDDPVFDSQSAFRAVMGAMATPGRPHTVAFDNIEPPKPLDVATAAVALCLFDFETPVWLDAATADAGTADYIRFHCGAPLVSSPDAASFAIVADPAAMPPLQDFNPGEEQYPDRSATLIVQVASLTDGQAFRLSGPGIETVIDVSAQGLPARFIADWRINHACYPTGVDVLLIAGRTIVGLPRSTRMES